LIRSARRLRRLAAKFVQRCVQWAALRERVRAFSISRLIRPAAARSLRRTSETATSKTMLNEMAQAKNKTPSAMVLKPARRPAPIEWSQTVAQVKASRAWARARNLRASAAEPIPAELRPGPKQALCILPMIRREGSLEHNRPAVVRTLWKDPRRGGARHISTEATRGHSGDRHRAHRHHLLLDSDGHHGGRRRVHRENRDRLRDSGGLHGDSHSEDDSREADCSSELRCPMGRARPELRRIRREQWLAAQAQTRSKPAAPTPHRAARVPAWTKQRC
jgi:hypothetical protein